MFEMKVDLTGLAEAYDEASNVDLSSLQEGLVNAAQYVRDVWRAAVTGTVLPGMKKAVHDEGYAKALSTGESLNFPKPLYAIVLPANYEEGVRSIEDGVEAFDMKTTKKLVEGQWRGGLLNGPNAKTGKNGSRYNTIPFRHYTPLQSGGGSSAISIKMQMPTEIYKQAKQLNRSRQDPTSGSMVWGENLKLDPAQWPAAKSWTGYQHKSSIYEGMYRMGQPNHTNYLTFRRVSTNSDPQSWWHPAISANSVIQAVYNYCMPEVEKNLVEIAKKAYGIA